MALELKGLRGKAIKAASNLDRLHKAYDAFNEAAPAHALDVEGLTPQIEGMGEDLHFATQILGNSVNGSSELEKPVETSKPLPATPPSPTPEIAPAPAAAPLTPGS